MVFISSIGPSLQIGLIAGATSTGSRRRDWLSRRLCPRPTGYALAHSDRYGAGHSDLAAASDVGRVYRALGSVQALADTRDCSAGPLWRASFGRRCRACANAAMSIWRCSRARISLEIIFLELLPPLLPYIGYVFSLSIVGSMLAEAGLQIIGLGAGGLPTLGFMIAKGFRESVIAIGLIGQDAAASRRLDLRLPGAEPDQYRAGRGLQSALEEDNRGRRLMPALLEIRGLSAGLAGSPHRHSGCQRSRSRCAGGRDSRHRR